MAILSSNTGVHYFAGACIFLMANACTSPSAGKYDVSIDTINAAIQLQSFYDWDGIVEGVHFINYQDGRTYACVLRDRHTLMLCNIADSKDTFCATTPYAINSLCVHDTNIYCFPEQSNTVKALTFSRSEHPAVREISINIAPVFDSNYSIKANFQSAILPLQDHKGFLIPYQCKTCVPNYLDSFVYTYFETTRVHNNVFKKLIRQPTTYLKQYEPLKAVVACLGTNNNKLYYTFQNQDTIYAYDLTNQQQYSALIPDCKRVPHGTHEPSDLSYRRQYTLLNDVNKRIISDDSGHVILIRKNAMDNEYPYTLFYYDRDLQLLHTCQVRQHLNHEILFLKNNQLYIHAHRSPTQMYRFTFTRKL